MNEVLFYGGIVLAGIFLLASIILFFYNKVYSAIAFFSHRDRKSYTKPTVKAGKKKKEKSNSVVQESSPQIGNDDTEILKSTEDYTEILCDDVTEILE
ncbi:MAG: hypothetical protein K6G47_07660 [Clostridia bacterium]|nr:hypothetical protein [Clostridia bacterium]